MHWLIPEPNPNPSRPTLLVYSSCHTHGILRYLNEHRADVRDRYNVSAILVHVAAEDPNARSSKAFIKAFREADFLLNHPLVDEKWRGMRADEIGLKNSCLGITMESPQMSCFWPVVEGPVLGELPVRSLLGQGANPGEVSAAFDSGKMDCYFAERFAADITRMRERDARSDLKSAEFIYSHHRDTKMFFTENHPTMPVLAWMTDQFLAKLGHASKSEEEILSLPLDTMHGENHFPETAYEWEHYRLKYPRRYEGNMGGAEHYHQIINRIASKP